jgi:hypothetical protein
MVSIMNAAPIVLVMTVNVIPLDFLATIPLLVMDAIRIPSAITHLVTHLAMDATIMI